MKIKKSYWVVVLCGCVALMALLLRTPTPTENESIQPPQEEVSRQQTEGGHQSSEEEITQRQRQEEIAAIVKKNTKLAGSSSMFADGKRYLRTPEAIHALRYGAEAMVTFRVVDSDGKPVEDAEMIIWLFPQTEAVGEKMDGLTDGNGMFTVSGWTKSYINFSIKKDGYYSSKSLRYWVYSETREICAEDGKWVPWNPTIEITLKEKRNPIPMYVKRLETKIPVWGEFVGYDFAKGDWVEPHGRGEVSDLEFFYTEDRTDRANYEMNLTMRFPEEHNGANPMKKDMAGAFKTGYTVSDDTFQQEFDYTVGRENDVYTHNDKWADDDYFAFRVRSRTNEVGEIVSAHYGKITSFEYAVGREGLMRLTYYFNPNENDRNIEFATGQNLFGRKEFNAEP